MAEGYLERVAGELADLALADQAASGDENIVDVIGEILGSSSQTLQEAYLTAVRVRRAEARARDLLSKRAGKPIREKSRLLPEETAPDEAEVETSTATEDPPEEAPASEEDAAFADVLNTLDEFMHADDDDAQGAAKVTPTHPTRS